MTYLITFACYGCHLHGEAAGSVDRDHNVPGSRVIDLDRRRLFAAHQAMDQSAYSMDEARRKVVLAAIVARCINRGWKILAAHVRTNHVHLVIEGEAQPERIMNDLKAFASRDLNQLGLDAQDRKRWARHGSTRYLWNEKGISAAVHYVMEKQGIPMSLYPQTEP